jgi:acyl-coenzyme A synthetase/AMP-(fatty) acid ligase
VVVKVVDQLPRTPSLKISRALVREHYFDGLGPHGSEAAADTTTTGEPHDH